MRWEEELFAGTRTEELDEPAEIDIADEDEEIEDVLDEDEEDLEEIDEDEEDEEDDAA